MPSSFDAAFVSDVEFGEEQFATNQPAVIHIAASQHPAWGQWHYWATDRRAIPEAMASFRKKGFDDCTSTPFTSRANWVATYGDRAPLVDDEIIFLEPHRRTEHQPSGNAQTSPHHGMDAPGMKSPFVTPGRQQGNIPPPPPPGHKGPFSPPP